MGDRMSRGLTALGATLQPFAQQKMRQDFLARQEAGRQQFELSRDEAARSHADALERRRQTFATQQAAVGQAWNMAEAERDRGWQREDQAFQAGRDEADRAFQARMTASQIGAAEDRAAAERNFRRQEADRAYLANVTAQFQRERIELNQRLEEMQIERAGSYSDEQRTIFDQIEADIRRQLAVNRETELQVRTTLGDPMFPETDAPPEPEPKPAGPVQASAEESVVPPPIKTKAGRGIVPAVTPSGAVSQAGLVPGGVARGTVGSEPVAKAPRKAQATAPGTAPTPPVEPPQVSGSSYPLMPEDVREEATKRAQEIINELRGDKKKRPRTAYDARRGRRDED